MSPAVITETLYGIAGRGEDWPQALCIVTTSKGKERLWQGLVEQGHLTALCQELGRPELPLSAEDILVVPDAAGAAVADARSAADHEAMADFIITVVRNLTGSDNRRIHASIAGGRKTMTFYLGYAMSLFGRHFDCLSHVLVSEGYENHPNFYYPTRATRIIRLPDGRELDTRHAEVTLADIPFIRQRHLLPSLLKDEGEKVSFRQTVELINLGQQPDDIRLTVDAPGQRLVLGSSADQNLRIEIEITNVWYWMFYLLILEDSCKSVDERDGYTRPLKEGADKSLALLMALKLAHVLEVQIAGDDLGQLATALLELDLLADRYPMLERSLRAVKEKDGVTGSQFSTYVNELQESLSQLLPENLVKLLVPTQVYDAEGERLQTVGKIKNKGAAYGVALPDPARQISFL